ncbi:MAG: hypothetical protein WCE79_02840 [Xanthobacteraceae bacterium]
MLSPPAFNKLCSYFHQDIGDDRPSPEQWIDFAKRHLDENEKLIVIRFVDELLDGDHDSAELQRIWFASGADVYFPEEDHLRGFLGLMRERLR